MREKVNSASAVARSTSFTVSFRECNFTGTVYYLARIRIIYATASPCSVISRSAMNMSSGVVTFKLK